MACLDKEIRFTDLAAQQKQILPGIRRRIDQVLAHGQYIMGPEVLEFEAALENYLGVSHAITCASGTDALLMALMAIGVGPGDAVFTTPFTFVATAEVIALLGATPVFVDVDQDTFNMDPECLERAVACLIGGGESLLVPKCIIPVDIFGLPADYERINAVAKKYRLTVLADAAQSFGSVFKGKKACTCVPIAATSFFPAKPLGCYGDGGAVFTSDDALAETLESIRVHGKGKEKYDNVRIGINGRLDTIQAAVLLEKLQIFDREFDLRQDVASMYHKALGNEVRFQKIPSGRTSVWAQFSLVSERRDSLIEALKAHGVPSAVYYPKPLHCQGAFQYLGYKPDDFPVSQRLSRTIFSLPMHPYLKADEVAYICDILHKN